jgi:hypothetical protein
MNNCWIDRYCGDSRNYECDSIACPPQPPHIAREYITDLIVHEFISEDRRLHPGHLHDRIKHDYHHDIAHIARHNEHKRKRPVGNVGREFSHLILSIARDLGLHLSHHTRAKHEGKSIYNPECSRIPLGDVEY